MEPTPANSNLIRKEERQHALKFLGIPSATPIALGTEAEVYEWDDRHVLKLYSDNDRLPQFETLRNFYNNLETGKSGLILPIIENIVHHRNIIAVIERRVAGIPLEELLPNLDEEQLMQAEDLYVDAMWKLKDIRIGKKPKTYLLFDKKQQSRITLDRSFEKFYADMLLQKIKRVSKFFELYIPSFPQKAVALVASLHDSQQPSLSIVHGDIFPGNVLVQEDLDPASGIGVIDFGSFTLFGNYLLDIAGGFGYYQMYNPNRTSIRWRLLTKVLDRLTPKERSMFFQYLLANAILTSDLYVNGPDPHTDDHFRWAVEIVNEKYFWEQAL
jgi:hypothetical protein